MVLGGPRGSCGLALAGLAYLLYLLMATNASAAPPRPPAPGELDPGLVLERGARPGDLGPKLEPIGRGRLRHRDPRFTAIIEADGSVEFRDPVGQSTLNFLGVERTRDGGIKLQQYKEPQGDFSERALFPHGPPTAAMFAGVGFRFGGLADGKRGQRHGSAKLAFLAATEALRLRMAYAWHKERIAEQQFEIIQQLARAWRDTRRSLADRKRHVFLTWDHCDDGAPTGHPLEDLRATAGAESRRKIEAFVRLVAPLGGPNQFTPAELAAFNSVRRSQRPFAHYVAPAE
jgi:hypothetical protein